MATVNVTESTFEQVVNGPGTVLVDFWASWCGPCRSFAPVYEKASERHAWMTFAKVDTEAEQGLAQSFNIRSIPTLMIIRDGVLLYSQPGALPEQALEQLIDQAEHLDMDEVRKSIAEQPTA